MVRPGYYADPSVIIDSLTAYHLAVSVPGEAVITATTTTPVSYRLLSGPQPLPDTMRHADISDSFPSVLNCPDEDQIFLLDVYCLESWEDARYINPLGDHDRPGNEEEYGYETEEPRHISTYFRIKDVAREGDTYSIGFYSAMMAFWGSYEVSLLAIDDNYYNYLYREHPEESGGIVGGSASSVRPAASATWWKSASEADRDVRTVKGAARPQRLCSSSCLHSRVRLPSEVPERPWSDSN